MRWLLLIADLSVSAAERVIEFHSDIRIANDGQLNVTERILVEVEGRSIRRGIVRDLPTVYRDGAGRHAVPFSIRRVTRDGLPENFQLERLSNGLRIRI